ncbi:MAG: hypothetical protein M0Q49_01890 [Porticoccaceae bacterium]|nr:hypothetical protein [Porticoccaceae bacterium]
MPYDLPRIPLPTSASSAELAALPAAIRRQALFSARLSRVEPLVEIGRSIKGILDGERSMSEARRDIRRALDAAGYEPPAGEAGTLKDHRSRRRLDLILQQNTRNARGYGKYAADMDQDVLDMWPAQELVRIMARRVPRTTWRQRWREAGGQLYGGRMIALKTSPVWVNLSRFGNPWPPYDYGSGMGVMDIGRAEAERLGLLTPEQHLTPEPLPYPEVAEARLPGLEEMPELQAAVLKAFGPGARFEGDTLSLAPPVQVPLPHTSAAELGYEALRDTAVTPLPAIVPPQEARALIASGEAVGTAPGRETVSIGPEVEQHWHDKGYSEAMIDARLHRIRHALAAIQEPQEVWERPDGTWYLKEFETEGKPVRILVQADPEGKVITWIPGGSRARYAESKRKGTLLRKEGAS